MNTPGGGVRSYSFWIADAMWFRFLVNGDDRLIKELFPHPYCKLRGMGEEPPGPQRPVLAD
jgi:hypothetical protein